jgi:hypothetical protein
MVVIMNNPPAFPNEGFNGWGEPEKGMTLRDYFAAKAMNGMCFGAPIPQKSELEAIAKRSYEMADAMLKAREQ